MSSAIRELMEQHRLISQPSEVAVVENVTFVDLELFEVDGKGALLRDLESDGDVENLVIFLSHSFF